MSFANRGRMLAPGPGSEFDSSSMSPQRSPSVASSAQNSERSRASSTQPYGGSGASSITTGTVGEPQSPNRSVPSRLTSFLKQIAKGNSKIERLAKKLKEPNGDAPFGGGMDPANSRDEDYLASENEETEKELLGEIEATKVLVAEAAALLASFRAPPDASVGERELFKGQHRKLSNSLADQSVEHEKIAKVTLEKIARLSSARTAASRRAREAREQATPLYPDLGGSAVSKPGQGTSPSGGNKSSSPALNQSSSSSSTAKGAAVVANNQNSGSSSSLLQELEQASSEAQSQIRKQERELQDVTQDDVGEDEVFRNELVAERNQEISGIHRDMATIQSLYKELAGHVEEQGSTIVQMEQSLESGVNHTELAQREIEETQRHMRRQTKLYSCLGTLTFICLCFILYFFYDLLHARSRSGSSGKALVDGNGDNQLYRAQKSLKTTLLQFFERGGGAALREDEEKLSAAEERNENDDFGSNAESHAPSSIAQWMLTETAHVAERTWQICPSASEVSSLLASSMSCIMGPLFSFFTFTHHDQREASRETTSSTANYNRPHDHGAHRSRAQRSTPPPSKPDVIVENIAGDSSNSHSSRHISAGDANLSILWE
ncbi:unnamed protein product [Amoebophrya sp. A25]|nr:unnamed protein product [Amoebophrya sp. A25]|eukprot:GSA25T00003599001.1